MPRLQMTAVDIVVTHAPAASYAAAAAREAGTTAVRAEGAKRSRHKRNVPGRARPSGSCRSHSNPAVLANCKQRPGPAALHFTRQLGSIATGGGRISNLKAAFLRWAMQLLSVSLRKGNAKIYRKSGLQRQDLPQIGTAMAISRGHARSHLRGGDEFLGQLL